MNKFYLFLLLSVFVYNTSKSQGCLPDGITFTRQTQIDSFQINYPGCTKVEGRIIIDEEENGNIVNLNGLSTLTSIGGTFHIWNTSLLKNFQGLENLDSIVGYIGILGNKSLQNLSGLENLEYIGFQIEINSNDSLKNLEGLNGLTYIRGITIRNNPLFTHLSGLDNVSELAYLILENNPSLQNLDALINLTLIDEDFKVIDNDSLLNLSGLNNLTHITSGIKIRNNMILESLSGLEQLNHVGGIDIYGNNHLMSIGSLENVSSTQLYINIHDNPLLPTCDVNCVCTFLTNGTGDAEIYNNSSGCNSIEEVEQDCLVSIKEKNDENALILYPNPATNIIKILGVNYIYIDKICIINFLNQKSIVTTETNTINISNLDQGIYIIEISTGEKKYRSKFIKR